MRGSLRHIAKTFFALGAAYTLLTGVIYVLGAVFYALIFENLLGRGSLSSYIVEDVIINATAILSAPFIAAAFTVLYYDLRCRHEGLDLETRIKQLTLEPVE